MRTLFISLISIFALNFQALNLVKAQDKKEKEKIEFEDSSKDKGGDIKFEDEEGPPTTGKVENITGGSDDLLTDDISDLGSLDDKKKKKTSTGKVAPGTKTKPGAEHQDSKTYWSDIKVVPRKLILKQKRIELIPYMGMTMNDNLIRHILIGGEFSYYLSDALSFGVGGHAFLKQQTDRAYLTGLQQRVLPTLNQYLYSFTLNSTYEAAYGKMAIHNKKILQWGIFLTGGVGITGTEVIPRNAGHEPWQNTNITIQIGVGMRVFISEWLTLWFSVRNYMMQDKFENTNRGPQQASAEDGEADSASRFINNIVFQIGLSIFYPTSFEYTTFK
ncbi:MAG: outer membrane beta-barrel domain-containing protein [Deltaproteobacteria bacterium]|jgi:outer membrane beta-barrel protein|nr:outer membrane beta-barrel domain-containing protein [Deltaproteobacteria bacterium]